MKEQKVSVNNCKQGTIVDRKLKRDWCSYDESTKEKQWFGMKVKKRGGGFI